MIAEVIERKSGSGGGYGVLGRYILNAKTNDDAVLWTRTAEYIMDTQGDGEKLAFFRISHCEADTPSMAMVEVLITQAQNTRAKSDKTYHLVVSFREGEQPTREQLADIEDTLCEGIGLGGHQRISAVHQNTDNLHIHIAINKIHPTRFTMVEPHYPYLKLDALCQELEIKHSLERDNRIGQGKGNSKAGEMEAFTGEQSLQTWLKENLADQLKQVKSTGQSWADVHAVLAEHNLLIKPRGAGLVIGTLDGTIHVKASRVDRSLSFKAMTDRFGEYEPAQLAQKLEPKAQYERGPKRGTPGTLWKQYEKEKEVGNQLRIKALQALQAARIVQVAALKDKYRDRRSQVNRNAVMTSRTKREVYQTISQEMKRALVVIRQQHAMQREAVWQQHPRFTWDAWLVGQAEKGDTEALGVLRNRQQTRKRLAHALLTADDLSEAKTIIQAHLKPMARKNGDMHYRLKDGGIVEDVQEAVHVMAVTEAATLLALTLADERFKGKALVVGGSTEFKAKVAEMAVVRGLDIRFSDENLEKARQRSVLIREESQKLGVEKSMSQGNNKRDDRGR